MKPKLFNSISTKILFSVVLVGAIVTSIFSSITIYFDYVKDKEKVVERLTQINKSNLDSIINSVWNLDYTQIQIALEGLIQLQDIEYVLIRDKNKIISEVGVKVKNQKISRIYPLKYKLNNRSEHIGDLYIEASLENVQKRVEDKAIFAFFAELVRMTLFGFLLLILIKYLLTRHIKSITNFFQLEENLISDLDLNLNRKNEFLHSVNDEIDILVESVNLMKRNLNEEFSKRKIAQKELVILNRELENKVNIRSAMLIESNKLAAIGEMAAGVAHEINSPLSTVYGSSKRILKLISKNEKFDEEHITELLDSQINTLNRIFMITNGLRSLSNPLIQEEYTLVNVETCMKEMMSSIEEIFRSRGVTVSFNFNKCDIDKEIQKEKVYQLLFSVISFRTKCLMGEISPWIKVSVDFVSDKFVIQFFDSIGHLTDEEVSVLKDPFVERQGIQKGSYLKLNSIKPLVDSLEAELILDNGTKDLIFAIESFI
jgi:C4-dicarboxylate-specific signal transduction histidine kinase